MLLLNWRVNPLLSVKDTPRESSSPDRGHSRTFSGSELAAVTSNYLQ